MSYTHENGRLITKNAAGVVTFDSNFGMMISFGVVSGFVVLPEYTTGAAHRVFENTYTLATGLDNRASFAKGHGKFDAGSYFTGAWCAIGGSSVILNRKNIAHTRYSVWIEVANNTLYMKSRQYISPNVTVQLSTVTYRLAILGFAAATT